jgi:parvulin-like peptidyl-prolyl isomerase
MVMSYKRTVVFTGVLLLLFFMSNAVMSAEVDRDKLPLITSSTDVVARVNGKDITEQELRNAVNTVMPMKSFHTSVSDKRFRAIRKQALVDLINDELFYRYALANKDIKVPDKKLKEALDNLKKRIKSTDTLENVLKRSNMTMKDLLDDFRRSFIINKVRMDAQLRIKKEAETLVNDKYLKNYYKTHLNKFKEPQQLHLRGILLKVDRTAGQRLWVKAKKKILDITAEAKKGADFAELAKKYSQAQSASRGGDMGWAHEGSLLPDIEASVSTLKVGEISKPVMSIYGFHLFKLIEKRPARQKKFSELNIKRLRKELVTKEFKLKWEAWLKGLRKGAKIEYLRRI